MPPENPLKPTFQNDKSLISPLKATLFAPPNQGVRDLCRSHGRSPCDAHTPQVHARSRFVVRTRFSLRTAGRPRGGQAEVYFDTALALMNPPRHSLVYFTAGCNATTTSTIRITDPNSAPAAPPTRLAHDPRQHGGVDAIRDKSGENSTTYAATIHASGDENRPRHVNVLAKRFESLSSKVEKGR